MNPRLLLKVAVFGLAGCLALTAAAGKPGATQAVHQAVDLQGHRGARGLLPENTIPGFLRALELGVTTLEMDVAINAEGHVVLSHEPWMSAEICRHPDGRDVTKKEEKSLRIYRMSDAELAGFDCGSRGHPDFPRQQAMPLAKPLLDEVLQAVAARSSASGRPPVLFNIGIKSRPENDGVFHPGVDEFSQILHSVLRDHDVLERTTVQSFDPRALEAMHRIDPEVSTALLISDSYDLEENLALLSYVPEIYSPNYELVDERLIRAAHARNIRVIPWTVNDAGSMRELLDRGVDGLITDYPGLGMEVLMQSRMQAKPGK
jgi:glycerophosphoryl diester phosphodiesterase